jgi:NADH-quinone oxidoreductase subunit M
MVYGAFAALAQKDFKRLVAYSSVSHMGYVVLGMGVWSAVSEYQFNPEYWQMGMNGAMFQMIAHGISSPGMFFLVGVVYDRVHHRNLDQFGGLFARMPVYSGLALVIFFAGLGLPARRTPARPFAAGAGHCRADRGAVHCAGRVSASGAGRDGPQRR